MNGRFRYAAGPIDCESGTFWNALPFSIREKGYLWLINQYEGVYGFTTQPEHSLSSLCDHQPTTHSSLY